MNIPLNVCFLLYAWLLHIYVEDDMTSEFYDYLTGALERKLGLSVWVRIPPNRRARNCDNGET
jgi:hypothetical protein